MSSPARQESPEDSARVAVVDADRRVSIHRRGAARAGVEVIGTAGDVRSALELVENLNPTVLLVDPRLPDIDAGRALLSGIALGWPSVRVVLMGWTDEPDGMPADAAFVSKSAQPEEFVAATVAACNC